MTLRTSLQRLIGRDPSRLSLRERSAETAARLSAARSSADAASAGPPQQEETPSREESADPIFALIDAHHTAFCAWDTSAAAWNGRLASEPGVKEAREASGPLDEAEERAFMALIGSLPTSLPGLVALADYLPGAIALRGTTEADDEATLALGGICASIRALVAASAMPVEVGGGEAADDAETVGRSPGVEVEAIAGLEFGAYVLDTPLRSTQEWAAEFSSRAMMLHIADRTLRMTKPELRAFIRDAGERDAGTPEAIFKGLDTAQETLEGWSNLLGLARARYIIAATAECREPAEEAEAVGPVEPVEGSGEVEEAPRVSDSTGRDIDFGPDAPIAALAAEFCDAFTRNAIADRAMMAGDLSEEEWQPHYDATVALMERLEATTPRTVLGMALKCLGPIAAAAWDVPRDGDRSRLARWERLGEEMETALMAGKLAPLDLSASPNLGLLIAARLDLKAMPLRDLVSLLGVAQLLEGTATAILCQPRCSTGKHHPEPHFNGAGLVAEAISDALSGLMSDVTRELRGRAPASRLERESRLAAIAEATVWNGHHEETATFARELLATVEP